MPTVLPPVPLRTKNDGLEEVAIGEAHDENDAHTNQSNFVRNAKENWLLTACGLTTGLKEKNVRI